MIRHSPLDSKRFGIKAGRASLDPGCDPSELLAEADNKGFDMVILRVPASVPRLLWELQEAGAKVVDALVTFAKELTGKAPAVQPPKGVTLRRAKAEDADAVASTAREAFSGYLGHYHADPLLDRNAATEAYADWAMRGVTDSSVADAVVIAEEKGEIVGFGLAKLHDAETAEGTLYGVKPKARGRGVYRAMVVWVEGWAANAGARRLLEVTQVWNIASQRTWTSLGFKPAGAVFTLHLWRRRP